MMEFWCDCQWRAERIKRVLREPLQRSQEITTELIMEGLASAGVRNVPSCECPRVREAFADLAPPGVDSQVLSSHRKRIKAVGLAPGLHPCVSNVRV